MIIRQTQNGSITERKTSPFKKKIHILSEKINDDNYTSNKNFFLNDIIKMPYIEINNYEKNNESKTIIPYQNHHSKLKFKTTKNKLGDKYIKKDKINRIIFDDKIFKYSEFINDNQSEKDNLYNFPQTSRYDCNIKEKYLEKFFKNLNDSNYNNTNNINMNYSKIKNEKNNTGSDIPNESSRTINTHSKRNNSTCINPIWKDNFNKNENKNIINTESITNESFLNLEEELNYEFEIRLLKKKLKENKKINDKLKNKIIKIKNEQKIKQIQDDKQKKKEYIISKVIDICKSINPIEKNNISSYNKTYNNEFTSKKIFNKYFKNDDLSEFPATQLFKNMLLNLMDLKYETDIISLKDEFILGIKNLLLSNKKNEVEFDDNEQNIYNNIKGLIKEEAKLKNKIHKYKFLSLENKKYHDYFSKLCKKLNLHDLEHLDKFLKNTMVKAEEEFKQINQIKKIVMENLNNDNFDKNITKEDYYKKIDDDNLKKVKNCNMHKNFKEKCQYCEQKILRNKNNSESKINRNLSSILKDEEKNIKRFSYIKDKRIINKSLINNNNIFKNIDDSINKKLINTYRCSASIQKNKNMSLNRQNPNEKINLYDFSKQKNYDYYINDYYNLENRDYVNEDTHNRSSKLSKIDIPQCIKSIKIYPYDSVKTINNKNKNYNNIINYKKKELGLNNKIKNRIKLNLRDMKNKKIIKNHIKDCFQKLNN